MKCIKWLMILSFSALMAGCASNVVQTHYYQLNTSILSTNNVNEPLVVKKSIWISTIDVADYLNQQGIVYQINSVEYAVANNHLWMTSLSDQIKFALIKDLSLLMPDYLVTNEIKNTTTKKVALKIDAFNGNYLGEAVISGRWIITHKKGNTFVKPFYCSQPLKKDGYEALIETLSSCFEKEVQLLITELK